MHRLQQKGKVSKKTKENLTTLMKWLEGRLPQPVDNLEQWDAE